MATIKQLYGGITEADSRDYKVSDLRQSIAKIFGKESNVREGL